jgi:hypothetical protein
MLRANEKGKFVSLVYSSQLNCAKTRMARACVGSRAAAPLFMIMADSTA